MNCSVMQDEPG